MLRMAVLVAVDRAQTTSERSPRGSIMSTARLAADAGDARAPDRTQGAGGPEFRARGPGDAAVPVDTG